MPREKPFGDLAAQLLDLIDGAASGLLQDLVDGLEVAGEVAPFRSEGRSTNTSKLDIRTIGRSSLPRSTFTKAS